MRILPQLKVKGSGEGGREGREERGEHEARPKAREKGGGVPGSVRSSVHPLGWSWGGGRQQWQGLDYERKDSEG